MKHDWGPASCIQCVNSHGSHHFLLHGPGKIAFTGTLMEKQAGGHPTVLKRQDLRGLLKSDLRDETQNCANWRSGLAGDSGSWFLAGGEVEGGFAQKSKSHHG